MYRFLLNCIIAFCAFLFLSFICLELFTWLSPQSSDRDTRDEENLLHSFLLSFLIVGVFMSRLRLKRIRKKMKNNEKKTPQ